MNFNEKVRAMALRLIGNNNAIIEAAKPKVYVALLTQSGTDAPVATVLENTLLEQDGAWGYDSTGTYVYNFPSTFPVGTVVCKISNSYDAIVTQEVVSPDGVYIRTYDIATQVEADSNLFNTLIEILVYP